MMFANVTRNFATI